MIVSQKHSIRVIEMKKALSFLAIGLLAPVLLIGQNTVIRGAVKDSVQTVTLRLRLFEKPSGERNAKLAGRHVLSPGGKKFLARYFSHIGRRVSDLF